VRGGEPPGIVIIQGLSIIAASRWQQISL